MKHLTCSELAPLLHASLEATLDLRESRMVRKHLRACASCRETLARERELSIRLGAVLQHAIPRRLWPRLAGAATLALVALLVAPVLLEQPAAYGSILQRKLDVSVRWDDGARTRLERSNHIDIPTGTRATIEIERVGVLQVTGPAIFELDKTPGGWKLTLLRGNLHVVLEDGARLTVASEFGVRTLKGGTHDVTFDAAFFSGAPVPERTPQLLLQTGLEAFSGMLPSSNAAMAKAAATLQKVLDHPRATAQQRETAGFYKACAEFNAGDVERALDTADRWLARHPDAAHRDYLIAMQVSGLVVLGRLEEAHAKAVLLAREHPGSDRVQGVKDLLKNHPPSPAETPVKPSPDERPDRARDQARAPGDRGQARGGYLVVTTGLHPEAAEHRHFRDVAALAAHFHDEARIAAWDGRDPEALAAVLRMHQPENVLFVVPPEVLDVNLHRRVLRIATTLDEDPFTDFAFGYLSARDGLALRRLWERTVDLHRDGLSSTRWLETAVTTARRPSWYSAGSIPPIAAAAGFEGGTTYFAIVESDPDILTFVAEGLKGLESASVISATGNGDPQGIWLFAGKRNRDRERHWDFDPDRVGEDPDGTMPRITAAMIRSLALSDPIVWSGTCHSGATHRVYVEGDIVSTFGRADGTAEYLMPPEESLCLAFLDAGATALLVPIAANHGMAVRREQDFVFREGATLGEAVKATYDDVILQADGKLTLSEFGAGRPPSHRREPIMQGAGANRILIGDPALRPFAATAQPGRQVAVTRNAAGLEVVVSLSSGFHAEGWDMYGTDQSRDWRVFARVPLDAEDPPGSPHATSTVVVHTPEGQPIPAVLRHAVVEDHHGRRFLHLQANGPRKAMSSQALEARFTVHWPHR